MQILDNSEYSDWYIIKKELDTMTDNVPIKDIPECGMFSIRKTDSIDWMETIPQCKPSTNNPTQTEMFDCYIDHRTVYDEDFIEKNFRKVPVCRFVNTGPLCIVNLFKHIEFIVSKDSKFIIGYTDKGIMYIPMIQMPPLLYIYVKYLQIMQNDKSHIVNIPLITGRKYTDYERNSIIYNTCATYFSIFLNSKQMQ
jgi:hypothetical protein